MAVEDDDEGFDTPESAAWGDVPSTYVQILGVRVRGDKATVWALTNDRPPYEAYTMFVERKGGRWHPGSGSNGLGVGWDDDEGLPPEIQAEAARLGWT